MIVGGSDSKNLPAVQETWIQSLGREDPLKEIATHSSVLAWKSHGQRSLVQGYGPWGCQESDTTERLHFHFAGVVFALIICSRNHADVIVKILNRMFMSYLNVG